MSVDWTFLDPWYGVLSACFTPGNPTAPPSEMQVLFMWPRNMGEQFKLALHLEEGNPENVNRLKQIREAIELFTVLAVVNNKAFTELFSRLTQPSNRDGHRYSPEWNVNICGTVTDQQNTWSGLLGLLDPSPHFKHAMKILKTMGFERTSTKNHFPTSSMIWECKCDGAEVGVGLNFDTSDELEADLRRLFTAGVTMVVQLGLPPEHAS